MSKLILLIHNESDVAALPQAAQAIVDHKYTGCWILHSPAIAADQAAAAARFDADIAALDAAEKAAAGRGDYNAAAEHQQARRGKELDRGKALTDAWKALTQDDRKNAYMAKLEPLRAAFTKHGINAKVDTLQDHYDREQWLQALTSLAGVWFKPFTHGSYSVAWPGAIPAIPAAPAATQIPVTTMAAPVKAVAPKVPVAKLPPASREEELSKLRHFGLVAAAKQAGVDPKGKSKPQIVSEIMAAENAQLQPA